MAAPKSKKRSAKAEITQSDTSKPVKRARLEPKDRRGEKSKEMSVDEFLSGGFLNIKGAADKGKTQNESDLKSSEFENNSTEKIGTTPKMKQTLARRAVKQHSGRSSQTTTTLQKDRGPQKQSKSASTGSEYRDHKQQIEALKETQPEFYSFLLETDKELLEFGNDSEESGDSAEGEGDEGIDAGSDASEELDAELHKGDEGDRESTLQMVQKVQKAKAKGAARTDFLTMDLVEKWCQDAKSLVAGALERLIKAYRVACHLGDEEEELDLTMKITNSNVFNKILLFTIKEAGPIMRKLMKLPEGHFTRSKLAQCPRWKKLQPLAKSFLGNSLHLLAEMTDEAMVVFMLKQLRASVVLLTASERLQRKYLKHVLQLFSQGKPGVRVQAVLFLRQMALLLPPPTLSLAIKGAYRSFVLNAKFTSLANVADINFMAAGVVELFGLDTAAAYEHAFSYVKQLATLLRTAMSAKTKDTFRQVYCWQTINSLELWAKLLSTYADNEDLKPLVYVVTQLLTGAIRLVPTPRYFPLRLRCIRALNSLSQATGSFIPVAPLLLEMLQWRGLHTAAKSGAKTELPALQLRAGKQLLATAAFQQNLVEEVLLLLAEHLAQWSTSPAFPEMAHLIMLQLRKVGRDSKVEKFRSAAKGLTAAITANSEYVNRARNRLECSPKDTAALAAFLASDADKQKAPMRKYAVMLRERAAQKSALRSTRELEVGGAGDLGGEEEEETGDLTPSINDLLPQLRKKAASKKKATSATPAAGSPGVGSVAPEAEAEESSSEEEDENGEDNANVQDRLQDYLPSESEYDAEEADEQ